MGFLHRARSFMRTCTFRQKRQRIYSLLSPCQPSPRDRRKEVNMAFLSLPLADTGITIKLGENVWSFSLGWNLLVYLLVAAIVGLIAEGIVGWRAPLGII